MHKRFWFVWFLSFFFLFSLLQEPAARAEENSSWEAILASLNGEVLEVTRQSLQVQRSLERQLEKQPEPFAVHTRNFNQLEAILRVKNGNPLESRNILLRINHTMERLEKDLLPLLQLQRQVATLSTQSNKLNKDLKILRESVTPELIPDVNSISNLLKESTTRLSATGKKVDAMVETGQKLQERLQSRRQQLTETLPALWKDFFLENHGALISPQTWVDTGPVLQVWATTVHQYFVPTWEEGKDILVFGLIKFVVIFIPLFIAGPVLFRKVFPGELSRRIFFPWALFALSLYLLVLSLGMIQSRTILISMAAHVTMALGLARLTWVLRLSLNGKPASGLPNPYYFILYALAVFFLHSTAPTQVVGTLWSVTLIGCGLLSLRVSRDTPFLLERTLLHLGPSVFFILAAVSISGWSNMTIIFFMGLFYVILGLQTSLSFGLVLKRVAEKIPDQKLYALFRALLLGLGSPISWLLVFVLMGIWFSAHLGGAFFLTQILDIQVGWGTISFNLVRVILIIVFFYLAMAVISIIRSTLHQMAYTWSKLSPTAVPSIQTLSTYAIWVVFFILALNFMGIDLTTFTVIAGGLSVGIGFGMQNLVNNFVSGLILLIGRAIKPGDIVQLGDLWGTVKDINIRTTTVQSFEKAIIVVPNSELISNQLTNWTGDNLVIRRDVNVGVAYGSDTQKVRDLLLQVAAEHPNVLDTPSPSVLFDDFGASSLDFILRVHIADINYSLSTLSSLRYEIDRVFRENQIEIAFPQLDLHIRSAPGIRELQGDKTREE